MANWRDDLGGNLLPSNVSASAYSGSAYDMRAGENWGFLETYVPAASAIVSLEASFDGVSRWYPTPYVNLTAVAAGYTAQTSGHFPFVRVVVNAIYSGGGNTGFPTFNYSPGY